MKKALVVGALGVIGRGMIDYLTKKDDWSVIGLSRRSPEYETTAEFISADLHDRDDCIDKLSGLGITHIFYAAYQAGDTLTAEVTPNTRMLVNAIEAVEVSGNNLEHVCLFQGAKAYGAHISAYRTPARESDPRHFPPNFYFNQEDYLRGREADGIDWAWSALRPGAVGGFSIGSPMNLVTALAVYGSVCKELNQPMRFPGSNAAFAALYQATDVELLAKCAAWAATSDQCKNEIFNITNGDYYRWEHVWPDFCTFFGTTHAAPQKMDLEKMMADKDVVWAKMQEKYGLQKIALDRLVNWPFTDVTLHREFDSISNTTKLRKFGFFEFVDSHEMYLQRFQELRDNKIIP